MTGVMGHVRPAGLTPAQLRLLRDVADGKVVEHFPTGRSPWTQRDRGLDSGLRGGRWQTVTAMTGVLMRAGLVELAPRASGRVTATVEITEKGRALL